ncbi:unnamed protein product [Pleuronectes platessa]|uniref:Uncharacterized protein n=1 Tax=Pleuronectes platessa TaxID=8262 RepID=A0A9N7UY48_PLEPL|nr:unnamed protein product [Pleuronectes platessa]
MRSEARSPLDRFPIRNRRLKQDRVTDNPPSFSSSSYAPSFLSSSRRPSLDLSSRAIIVICRKLVKILVQYIHLPNGNVTTAPAPSSKPIGCHLMGNKPVWTADIQAKMFFSPTAINPSMLCCLPSTCLTSYTPLPPVEPYGHQTWVHSSSPCAIA